MEIKMPESSSKPVLVTCGLPYANGKAHVGHLRTYVPADIFVRSLRKEGRDVTFVCGSDTHAAAFILLLEAENNKEVPFAFVEYVSFGLLRRVVIRSSDRREMLKICREVEKIKAGLMPERKEDKFCKECNFSERCVPDSSLMSKYF